MTESITASDQLLLDAGNYIKTNGWSRCKWNGTGKSKCMLGAVIYCAFEKNKLSPEIYALAVTKLKLACNSNYLLRWNDDFFRNKQEVIDILFKAAGKSLDLPY